MDIDFPLGLDPRGRSRSTTEDDHIRDMIEQVLFTAPGERVNRPTFGSGLLELVFGPNSDALAATARMAAEGALQQWLGELIQVEAVNVDSEDSTLRITVQYVVRRTQERRVTELRRGP
jgi:phage baseplate assembly protein W